MANKCIVKFKDGTDVTTINAALEGVGENTHTFEHVFSGFAARLDNLAVELLRQFPDVEYIEQDVSGTSTGYITESGSTWGLARISHRDNTQDDGVDDTHPEFEGRAHQIKSFVPGAETDDLGHGTHCAGTIGYKTYGVAKKVHIYSVKVINSEDRFHYSDLIAAYDFIAKDSSSRDCPNGVIVSGSLSGAFSTLLNNAADAMADKGFFMAVSAGNKKEDVNGYSRSSASKVCTVGGVDRHDKAYTYSNFGSGVNIIAPAVDVKSTLPGTKVGYSTGTSMATPHVAGLDAYFASRDGVKASPALCDQIVKSATRDAISDQFDGTVNLIAFNENSSA
ncbi:hypothetical protein K4F52_000316 [Lecanicillium sp. MT-2017a]|nr:hypothetical protein K4F52_000316 [Lecanicillium sp. MT-2017a]